MSTVGAQRKSISVLHILECPGGVVRYLQMLMPRLRAKGIEQKVICSPSVDAASFSEEGFPVEQMPIGRSQSPISIIRAIYGLRKRLKAEHFDIIYCHSSFAGAFGRVAAIGLGCKVVYNPHGWAFNIHSSAKIVRGFYLLVEKVLARHTDAIVCISKSEEAESIRRKVCRTDKLHLVENGIDIDEVANAVAIDKVSLGFSENDYVVGMVGRISKQKSPDTFIKAAKLIKGSIPNAVFLIVGDGEDRKDIESFAKDNGVNLVVTGWVKNPYSYMKVMNVGLLISRWEGFGLVIPELMAAGVNVISTKVDAITTLVTDGQNGFLVDIDSPSQVCDKVLWLHDNPSEAEKIRNNAIESLGRFDISRVCNQHVELFDNLMQ